MSQGGKLAVIAFVAAALASACASKPPTSVAHAAAPAVEPPSADGDGDGNAPDGDDETATSDDGSDSADSADSARVETNAAAGPCPAEMALVEIAAPSPRRFCVDKYEASLVEVLPDGTEKPFPHYVPVDGHDVRAVSRPSTFPQGYISEVQAQDACGASGKRLCSPDEWKTACMGPSRTTFPYGDARRPGACHDTGKSAVLAVFGAKAVAASTPSPVIIAANTRHAHTTKGRAAQTTRPRATAAKTARKPPGKTSGKAVSSSVSSKKRALTGKKSARPSNVDPGVWAHLNDPGLGQVDGALAKTGEHAECVNGFGVFDMVGNLHEWVATDPAAVHGTFAGGYYLDTTLNGDGCNYRTVAHAHDYHDYSTGFRCCSATSRPAP